MYTVTMKNGNGQTVGTVFFKKKGDAYTRIQHILKDDTDNCTCELRHTQKSKSVYEDYNATNWQEARITRS